MVKLVTSIPSSNFEKPDETHMALISAESDDLEHIRNGTVQKIVFTFP